MDYVRLRRQVFESFSLVEKLREKGHTEFSFSLVLLNIVVDMFFIHLVTFVSLWYTILLHVIPYQRYAVYQYSVIN
jgi:hypothetical protein